MYSEEQIHTIPTIDITSQHASDGVVCREAYQEGETVRQLQCGHMFHTDCTFSGL